MICIRVIEHTIYNIIQWCPKNKNDFLGMDKCRKPSGIFSQSNFSIPDFELNKQKNLALKIPDSKYPPFLEL